MSTNRRAFMRRAGAFAGLAAMGWVPRSWAVEPPPAKPMAKRLLFVISATGGASLVDSFLARRASECSSSSIADQLIVYPDETVQSVPGTSLRALDLPSGWATYADGMTGNGYRQSTFLTKHHAHMAVMTLENMGVNHRVAQVRAMNGDFVNGGKTIGEQIAEIHGQSMVLPYVNMGVDGFLAPGRDASLPAYARAEAVVVPHLFALRNDGMRGMIGAPGGAPFQAPKAGDELERGRALLARARAIRAQLDDTSMFGQTFQCSDLRARFLALQSRASEVEIDDLISNLFLFRDADFADSPTPFTLADYGLQESPAAADMRAVMDAIPPGGQANSPLHDPLHAQTCLAYLLARYGYSAAVTLGLGFDATPSPHLLKVETPLAFDHSHHNHVATQQAMWGRTLEYTDKLIALLQQTPTGEGDTMWDRSLIYLATDFGRTKQRNEAGMPLNTVEGTSPVRTGHHTNNGCVLLSPLVKAGQFGDVDPDTLLTYGFDRNTGQALAGPEHLIRIQDVYTTICQALDAPFSGMEAVQALKRR